MSLILTFTQVVHEGYHIVFQGNAIKDLDSVEEVIVAIDQGKSSQEYASSLGEI